MNGSVHLHPGTVSSRRSGFFAVTAAALIAIAAGVIAWSRIPAGARDTLWAEDGRLFLHAAAISSGQGGSLLEPYAGYLHLVPRLEALATVDLVPVQWWALSMTALSCAIAGLVAAVAFVCSRDVVPWLPARILLALLTVATPLASREVLGNAANVHSLLFWGLFWVLLYRPRTEVATGALAVFALAASLSDVQSVLLLPLLPWSRRDRRTWPVKAAVVIGATSQVVTAIVAPRGSSGRSTVGPPSIVDGWLINAVATSWVPIPRMGAVLAASGGLVAVLVLIPTAAVLVTVCWGTTRERALAWMLAAGSALVWTAGVVANPAPWYAYATMDAAQLQHVWLSRYGVVPAMMLLALVCVAAGVLRRQRRVPRAAPVALVVVLSVALVPQLSEALSRRDAGPEWQPQISASAERCERPGLRATALRETLTWRVVVPCRYFDEIDASG